MPSLDHRALADVLLPAVLEAGRLVLDIRAAGLTVEKKGDDSPVTAADRGAEAILTSALHRAMPEVPVIAEEANAAEAASRPGGSFFLVDPLDGTKDFVAGRNEFSINVGLIEKGRPVFGLIYAPAREELFVTTARNAAVEARVAPDSAAVDLAALDCRTLKVKQPSRGCVALVSRSEAGPDHAGRVADFGATEVIGMSSAVKFGLVARGDADFYARFGPTCEWDTAAGQAILEAAGGSLTNLDGTPFVYGKADQGFLNPGFIARSVRP